MNVEIKGKFKAAGETKELSNGITITKFYLDLDTDTEYPTMCEIQNYDNKVDISGLKPGDEVTVSCNLRGRKWTNPEGKTYFFQSLNAWKIETQTASAPVQTKTDELAPIEGSDDSLPF